MRGEQIEVSINGERVALLDINYADERGGPERHEPDDAARSTCKRRAAARLGRVRASASKVPVDDLIAPIEHTLADTQIGDGFGITDAAAPARLRRHRPVQGDGRLRHAEPPKIFICRPTAPAEEAPCATQILTASGDAGVPPPAHAARRRGLMEFYDEGAQARRTSRPAFASALQAMLASPYFVFRLEEAPATVRAGPELPRSAISISRRGCRSSSGAAVPDDELLSSPRSGTLSHAGVLEKQVQRMLADPRVRSAVDALRRAVAAPAGPRQGPPRRALFPDLRRTARARRCKRETELFFDNIVREDRSVLDLLTADYTFVNERLAQALRHPERRRRRLPPRDANPTSNRRGLLGQGSMLMLTSLANRTSPVLRGKWVMEVLLGIAAAAAAAERAGARRDEGRRRRTASR